MKKLTLAVALAVAATGALAADMTEDQKVLYAIGQVFARQAGIFNLTPAEVDIVQRGFRDGATGAKSAVEMREYAPKIQQLAETRQAASAEKEGAAGREHLAKAAAEKGAVKAPNGLVYRSLRDGKGASPAAADTVKVHYRGTLLDGREFDSSYGRNEPAEFALGGVIKCWTEGVQKMKVGGKAKLTCPPDLAYGPAGAGGVIPPNATLTFEVELLSIKGK